jgi:diguanylate cyclase (GGDEF)-like protein
MSDRQNKHDQQSFARLADESGMAIAYVDAQSRQIDALNDNSICRSLNPTGEFSPACAEFCGKALEMASEAGEMIAYECHAGLACRAVMVRIGDQPLAAVVGRTFVTLENYRKATERAISGDWCSFKPEGFFSNILLTGSQGVLDRTVKRFVALAAEASPFPIANAPGDEPVTEIEPVKETTAKQEPAQTADETQLLELEPAAAVPLKRSGNRKRSAEISAWRSFFSSILKTDHLNAARSILEFLGLNYGISSLVWLNNNGSQFDTTAGYGKMKGRRLRVSIDPVDKRLIDSLQGESPLKLGERSRSGTGERNMLLFPIGISGEVSAVIGVLDPIKDDNITRQIARICHSIAPQIEILRLREEINRNETTSNAVRRFSESLKRLDHDDLWLNLTLNTAEMLGAERASLLIFNRKAEKLEIKAMVGNTAFLPDDDDVGERVANIVLVKNEVVAVADVSKTSLPPTPPERNYRTASFLSCPITIGGRTIGVMNFTDRVGGEVFDKDSLTLFQAIAPQLAVAIDRAMLKERAGEFEQLSVTDPLTGLLNRRYMEERLLEEVKRSNRHGFPMSYMMIDVDLFKTYNDQFGHPAGDEALKRVGNVIRETLRSADVAARYGGEEFSILLPQTTGEKAAAIAERIRFNVENEKFTHRQITISIGVASCAAEVCSSKVLVSAADKALYEAKRRGRNMVLAFEAMLGKPAETSS